MGHMHVVDVCRGQHSFSGACRGDNDRMSWNTTMSWMYVVDHMLFHTSTRRLRIVQIFPVVRTIVRTTNGFRHLKRV